MRSPIRKQVVKLFAARMETQLPNFGRCRNERNVARDLPTWAFELAPSFTCFVMLQPFDGKDDFVLEIGWAPDGNVPWDGDYRTNRALYRDRLAAPWAKDLRRVPVWEVAPAETGRSSTSELPR